jgi:hypothetical protein
VYCIPQKYRALTAVVLKILCCMSVDGKPLIEYGAEHRRPSRTHEEA